MAVNAPEKLKELFTDKHESEIAEVGEAWWKRGKGQRRDSADSE